MRTLVIMLDYACNNGKTERYLKIQYEKIFDRIYDASV